MKCLHATWQWKVNGEMQNAEACMPSNSGLLCDIEKMPLGATDMFHEICDKTSTTKRKARWHVVVCKCDAKFKPQTQTNKE